MLEAVRSDSKEYYSASSDPRAIIIGNNRRKCQALSRVPDGPTERQAPDGWVAPLSRVHCEIPLVSMLSFSLLYQLVLMVSYCKLHRLVYPLYNK